MRAKAKAIVYQPDKTYQFILFYVVPLALGLLITCQSIAKADWDAQDPRLVETPLNQGWRAID